MGIKFLGTPLKQFDQLCSEEEIVSISIETFKMEEFGHFDGSTTMERVKTGGWGMQIKSSKDIFQFDDEQDDYPVKNELSDKTKESLR